MLPRWPEGSVTQGNTGSTVKLLTSVARASVRGVGLSWRWAVGGPAGLEGCRGDDGKVGSREIDPAALAAEPLPRFHGTLKRLSLLSCVESAWECSLGPRARGVVLDKGDGGIRGDLG
jgi:hypothetical protein